LSSRNRLIGIVDDELDIARLFRDALQRINGFSVFAFTDPKTALEHFRINNAAYVMVISDLRMPSINGMELIKNIRDLNPFVWTILMTAYAIKDDLFQEYAKQEIINGFLQKPVHLTDLYTEVNNQLLAYESDKKHPSQD
jgi:DNA-binding NtrC family response regulator